jgi:hypothetical protein
MKDEEKSEKDRKRKKGKVGVDIVLKYDMAMVTIW